MRFVNRSGRDRWPHILAQRYAIKIGDVTVVMDCLDNRYIALFICLHLNTAHSMVS